MNEKKSTSEKLYLIGRKAFIKHHQYIAQLLAETKSLYTQTNTKTLGLNNKAVNNTPISINLTLNK